MQATFSLYPSPASAPDSSPPPLLSPPDLRQFRNPISYSTNFPPPPLIPFPWHQDYCAYIYSQTTLNDLMSIVSISVIFMSSTVLYQVAWRALWTEVIHPKWFLKTEPAMDVGSNITLNFTYKLKQNTSFDTGSNLILQRFVNYRNQGSTPCDDNADHREQPARSRLSRLSRLSRWRWRAGGKRATSLTYPGANCLS